MEQITIIQGKESYDQHKFLLEQNVDYQRLKFYRGVIYAFNFVNKKEIDTHIYWSSCHKKPMFENGKLFYKSETLHGATYDKKTKKFKIWFGKNFNRLDTTIVEDIFKTISWKMPNSTYLCLITNGILNKLSTGKVKSTQGIIDEFCKYNPYRKFNLDTEKLDKLFTHSSSFINLRDYKHVFLASANPNDVVDYMLNNMNTFYIRMHDMQQIAKTALCIDKTIDINWSSEDVHNQLLKYNEERRSLERIHEGLLGLERVNEDLPF